MECLVLRMRGCIATMAPRTIQETQGSGSTRRGGLPRLRWPCKPPKGYARYGREGARRIAQQSPMNSRTHGSTQPLDVAELVIDVAVEGEARGPGGGDAGADVVPSAVEVARERRAADEGLAAAVEFGQHVEVRVGRDGGAGSAVNSPTARRCVVGQLPVFRSGRYAGELTPRWRHWGQRLSALMEKA